MLSSRVPMETRYYEAYNRSTVHLVSIGETPIECITPTGIRTSERTVARMVADGCPSILVGCRRRFDLHDVLAWSTARACLPNNSPRVRGTSLSASTVAAFTDACRKVHLRVRPSNSRPTSAQHSASVSQLSPVTRD